VLQARIVAPHLLDLPDAFWAGDHGYGAGVLGPELEVAGAELRGAGDGDGAELEEAGEDRMPLGDLAEQDHHPIFAANARVSHRVSESVGEPGEVAER